MDGENELKAELAHHEDFFVIASQHNAHVKHLVAERDTRQGKDDLAVDFVCEKNTAIQREAMVAVIFSALALEAFINYYAIEYTSGNYFKNHLERLDPVTKWVLIPKLISGRQIDTGGQAYEKLTWLFGLRNNLVHYKFRRKAISHFTEEKDWVTENHSADAIITVQCIMEELHSIDNDVDIAWVDVAAECS